MLTPFKDAAKSGSGRVMVSDHNLAVLPRSSFFYIQEIISSVDAYYRVRTENLEKSWNFKMVISRPGKVMKTT